MHDREEYTTRLLVVRSLYRQKKLDDKVSIRYVWYFMSVMLI